MSFRQSDMEVTKTDLKKFFHYTWYLTTESIKFFSFSLYPSATDVQKPTGASRLMGIVKPEVLR